MKTVDFLLFTVNISHIYKKHFHRNSRATHPHHGAAHTVLFCKQSDSFFGVFMWGRVDGVISAVMGADLPVEKNTLTTKHQGLDFPGIQHALKHNLSTVC